MHYKCLWSCCITPSGRQRAEETKCSFHFPPLPFSTAATSGREVFKASEKKVNLQQVFQSSGTFQWLRQPLRYYKGNVPQVTQSWAVSALHSTGMTSAHKYNRRKKKTWTKTEEDLLKSSYLQMTLLLFPYRHHSSCLFDWVINLLCFAYAERNTQPWRNLSSMKNHDGPTESLTKPYKWQQYLWQQAIQIWSLELLVKILCKATQFIVSLNI